MFGFFKRWKKYRQLKARAWQAEVVTIKNLGEVSINPMPVPLRMALVAAISQDRYVKYDVYCWLISECVVEFLGRDDLGMTIPPAVIDELGEKILQVSGLTNDAQEDTAKKSLNAQS